MTRWAPLLALVALAAALRVHGLDAQLWIDEIDAVTDSIRRPARAIATEWPHATSHVLYDLTARAFVRVLGETATAVRLPAAVFGIAGVGAMFVLADSLFDRRLAVVCGGLLAVSYHHVFYSQNARGYTALFFFGLVSSLLVLRFRRASAVGRGEGTACAVAYALAAYAMPFGVFLLAGHLAVVLVHRTRTWLARETESFPWARYLVVAAAGGFLIAASYAPLVASLYSFLGEQTRLPTGGGGVSGGGVYRLGFAFEGLRGLSISFGGPAGLAAAFVIGLIGAWRWWRRDAFSLALLLAPSVLQAVVLVAADVPLSPRYFVLALAPLVAALAQGLVPLVGRLARAAGPRWEGTLAAVVLTAAVLATAVPLAGYYRVPKQDFLGAIESVDVRAAPGDLRLAVHHAARAICGYYHADFLPVRSLADLEERERSGRRIWLVTTLDRFLAVERPDIYRHVRGSYRAVVLLPATVGGAEMVLYERDGVSR